MINSTPAGRALIHSLPDVATRPDMTAHWESKLTAISEKQCRYSDFMQPLEQQLYAMIELVRHASPPAAMRVLASVSAASSAGKRQTTASRRTSRTSASQHSASAADTDKSDKAITSSAAKKRALSVLVSVGNPNNNTLLARHIQSASNR